MMKKNDKTTYILLAVFLLLIAGYFLSKYAKTLGNVLAEKKAGIASEEQTSDETSDDTDLQDYPFEVVFLDVGQGDCTMIRCGDHYMLIDAGTMDYASKVRELLNSYGVRHLDAIIATHDHADHIGGMSGAIRAMITTDHLYCSMERSDEEAFDSFVYKAALEGLKIEVPAVGDTFTLGEAEVVFMGPSDALQDDPNSNNRSLVIKVTYKETSVLITGDAEVEELDELVRSGQDLSADILKVGHHGSSNGITEVFFGLVHPKYAVISCGKDNDYGHPHRKTLSVLGLGLVELYRTDLQGTVIMVSDGNTIEFRTEQEAELADLWTKGKYDPE